MDKEKKHNEMVSKVEESQQQKIIEDKKLDEVLMQTFPASDPISYSIPGRD